MWRKNHLKHVKGLLRENCFYSGLEQITGEKLGQTTADKIGCHPQRYQL